MGQPAARLGDYHACPMVTPGTPPIPHVGGPILPTCSFNVLTGKIPQARVTDKCVCVGPPDVIVKGSATVLVNKLPAARMFDSTAHGGVIMKGEFTVLIGDGGAGGGGAFEMMVGPNGAMQMMLTNNWQKAAMGTAQSTPGLAGTMSEIERLLSAELRGEIMTTVVDQMGKILSNLLRQDAGEAAFKLVRPFVTQGTADAVKDTAAKFSIGAKVAEVSVAVAGDAVAFAEAAGDAYYTHKFAKEGNLKATSISAANTTGATIAATAGIVAGWGVEAVFATAVAASAPAWVPVAVGVGVAVAVGVGAKWAWDKWGQEPATKAFDNYINSPPS